MRPVADEFETNQDFGAMPTAGVVGNRNASNTTVAYWVALYGNYQPFGHAGMDILCPVGTPVHAIADGTVLWADWGWKLPGDDSWSSSGYFKRWALYKMFPGIVTVIQHKGWISVYAHLSDNDAAPKGTVVKEGQLIGKSGASSGYSVNGVGAHLHVEALVDLSFSTGKGLIYGRTDPSKFFGGISAQGTISQEDEFLMALTEQQQKDVYWILCTESGREYLRTQVLQIDKTLTKADGAYMNKMRDAQHAAEMTALDQNLDKDDGNFIVGLIQATKPGAEDPQAAVDAILKVLPSSIAKQVADELSNRLKG